MSRFFASDSESDSDDGNEKQAPAPTSSFTKPKAAAAKSFFSKAGDDSDDEPQQKRVVKSQKDKVYEELENEVNVTKNHVKSDEWALVSQDFEKLNKILVKIQTASPGDPVPRLYTKTMIMLEKKVKLALSSKKKLIQVNNKALNQMKLKVNKNNKQYEKDIQEYKKNPDKKSDGEESEEEEEDKSEEEPEKKEESEESEEEPAPAPAKSKAKASAKAKAKAAAPKAASTEETEDKAEGAPKAEAKVAAKGKAATKAAGKAKGAAKAEAPKAEVKEEPEKQKVVSVKKDDNEEDSEDENSFQQVQEAAPKNKWLKADNKDDASKKDKKKKPTPGAPGAPGVPGVPGVPGTPGATTVSAPSTDKKKSENDEEQPAKGEEEELDKETIDKKLEEIIANRGKKGTDKTEQLQQLNFLLDRAKSTEQTVAILMNLVSSMFDINIGSHLSAENWKKVHQLLVRILHTVKTENVKVEEPRDENEFQISSAETAERKIVGTLLAFIERLDDELLKALQLTDPHTEEYVKRLHDENLFLEISRSVLEYYLSVNSKNKAARVALRIIEHIYYKTETKSDVSTTLRELSTLVYEHGDERQFAKVRTVLCNIYHLALRDNFFEARDLLLMSHIQDNILHMDISTQILYNRAMVQLGLCAFRKGLIAEAHSALSEVCSSGKVKELLAQGVATGRYVEKNPEQEKLEKKRQIPYHMHVNLELLECVHLICAMLLEIPNMASNPYEGKKRVISRQFRKLLDYNERQVFNGPPENIRDHVLSASRALGRGEWKTCEKLLLELAVWNLVPSAESIKAMLKKKIQEEGLRTYLFTYSRFYYSLSLTDLSQMFELPANTVHSLISKMMINEELHATWDQPTSSIVMHRVEPSRLQFLALQFSDRANSFVENNEKILDPRLGHKFDQKGAPKEKWQNQDGNPSYQYANRQYTGLSQNRRHNNNNNNNSNNNNNKGRMYARDNQ